MWPRHRAAVVAVIALPLLIGKAILLAGEPPFARNRPLSPHPFFRLAPAAPAAALATSNGWAKVLAPGTGYVSLVTITPAGELVFGGPTSEHGAGGWDALLVQLDANGSLVSQHVYGTVRDDGNSVMPTSDGGYLLDVVTSLSDQWYDNQSRLVKLNGSGVIAWQRAIGTLSGVPGYAPSPTSPTIWGGSPLQDGSILLETSVIRSVPSAVAEVCAKLNALGQLLWLKWYSHAESVFAPVNEIIDGSLLAEGKLGTATGLLMKISPVTGEILWQKSFPGLGAGHRLWALPTLDAGYLVHIWPAGGDLTLVKLTSAGALEWQKRYSGSTFSAAAPLAGGGYLLQGSTTTAGAGDRDAILARLDAAGNVLWGKIYGGPAYDSLVAGPDDGGGLLLSGNTSSFGNGETDILLAKLDDTGTVLWQSTYGGAGFDAGFALRLAGGDLLVSGTTDSHEIAAAGGAVSGTAYVEPQAFVAILDSVGRFGGACDLDSTPALVVSPHTVTAVPGTITLSSPGVAAANASVTFSGSDLTAGTPALSPASLCSEPPPLTAAASANATAGSIPLSVTFAASAVNGTPPYVFDWDFGDGSPHSGAQSPSHVYPSIGSFSVTLTVTDAASATATDVLTITAEPPKRRLRRVLK